MDDLTWEHWERLSTQERENLAKRLVRQLPQGFDYHAVRRLRFGEQEHEMAGFRYGENIFVFLPGGTFTIGYDPDRFWEPTSEEQEDWEITAADYEIDRTIQEHIAAVTMKPRTVYLPPLLFENEAFEIGWMPLTGREPNVKDIVHEYFQDGADPGEVKVCLEDDIWIRVYRDVEKKIVAEASSGATHADCVRTFAEKGFRLPTFDEWEYACGGGASTLFRWGDHPPFDRDPINNGIHTHWNAFGIRIAYNPYHYELVAEPDFTRGGDGGSMLCGGTGLFISWLTLATAYFEPEVCTRDRREPIPVGYTVGRRVLPLS